MRRLVFVAFVCASVACSAPRIDTSSDETTKESIEKVKASLPEEQREKFGEALLIVAMKDVEDLGDLVALGSGPSKTSADLMKGLNGMSGREVLEEADRILALRKEKERQQALVEIAELEKKKAAAETAKAELAKFEVIKSRFRLQKRQFGRAQPIVELSVKNGTEHAISRAYFKGVLASPGRSVPWLQEDFNYQIRGGLEPGESADWSLAPNMFSSWGEVEPRKDMVLTVETVRLDGPDGETLYDSDFSETELERLETLRKEYQE